MANKRLFKLSGLMVLILGLLIFSQCKTEPPSKSQLEDGFFNPSKENRALALWPWLNGYVDTTKLVYELEQMKDKGMRGALIWDVGVLMDEDKVTEYRN